MRTFLMIIVCILLLIGDKVTSIITPPQVYVPLIIKIREYYHTSTVFTVHANNPRQNYGDSFSMAYITHTWSRMLSREGIVTLDVNFERIHHRALRYMGNSVRPLFLVIISDEEAFQKFSTVTETFTMPFAAWVVLFLLPPIKGHRDHCRNPIGNPFNVNFNVDLLVLCSGDNVLREWYSIDGKNTEISELAIWKKELASPFILLTNLTLYDRRRNLKGMILRGVFSKNSPLFRIRNGKPEGMMGHIILELMEAMNFTVDMQGNAKYGLITKNGTWDGAIGELAAGRADIGVCEFSMTASRMKAVDYLIPLLVSRNCLYMKQPNTMAVQWFAYFKAFSFWVWSCVIAVILFTTVLIWIIYTYSGSPRIIGLVSDSFLTVWGIFCQQGLSEFPRASSLRVAYFTTFIAAVVVSAAYSAALISFLTACTHSLPFRTFEEFVHNGHHRLIVLRSTADYELLTESGEKHSRAAKSIMMPEHTLPKDMEEAFEQICSNPKLVFYASHFKVITTVYWTPCQVSVIDAGRIDTMSMAVPRGSQYTDILNHNILKFMFNGMINRLKGQKVKMRSDQDRIFYPVKMNNVAPILTIFCCGAALGLVVLIIEKCYFFVNEEIQVETGIS